MRREILEIIGWAVLTVLLFFAAAFVSGCDMMIRIGVRAIESQPYTPTTRPWHFEGEQVIYDGE